MRLHIFTTALTILFTFAAHTETTQGPMQDPFIKEETIRQMLGENPFVISPEKVEQIISATGLTKAELLQRLIPIAQTYARPAVSNYYVGAAGLGASGTMYLGVNVEFTGFHLNQCIHGEQFLVANARNQGEKELTHLALSAAPCGHCRQFLNEMGTDSSLQIVIPNREARSLAEFLPDAFGPHDLGLQGGLLSSCVKHVGSDAMTLVDRATAAALTSYAPYSKSLSGVAIRTKQGAVYTGGCMENVGFNPSLSPFHAAIVALIADNCAYEDISEVVLVEQESALISHAAQIEALLKWIAPEASFHRELFQ